MLILPAIGPLALIRTCADAFDRLDPSPAEAVSWFEEDVGRFRLEVYAATEEHVDVCLALLGAEAPDLHVNVAPVEDANWVAMALDGLPPVRAGRFVVAGAHALARAPQGATRIWIEASEAFGTGHHGTTMGCLLALDGMVKRGRRPRRVLDVGAGSGVLAIAAAKVGAKALGVEIDARAAEIARENIKNNKVAASVRMLTADGVRVARARPGHYDLVFANILMRPLIRMAPALIGAMAPGGRIVLSGLLVGQVPLVRAAYENRGLTMTARRRRHGWATLTFIKP
jgi:ribosomal protein L11 methyltransferase